MLTVVPAINSHPPTPEHSFHSPWQNHRHRRYKAGLRSRLTATRRWFSPSVSETVTDPGGLTASWQASAFRERHQSEGHNAATHKELSVIALLCLIELNDPFFFFLVINKSYLYLGFLSFPHRVFPADVGSGGGGEKDGCGEGISGGRPAIWEFSAIQEKYRREKTVFFLNFPFACPPSSHRLPRVRTLVSKSSQQIAHLQLARIWPSGL